MLGIKGFSWVSFLIGAGAGFVVGVLLLGFFVNYLISHAISDTSTSGLFGGAINQVREGISKVNEEKVATSVYGHVVSLDLKTGTLVLQVAQVDGNKQFTFVIDNSTTIVYLANDAASTQVPLSSDQLKVGDGLTVTTNEPVGSVTNQHAVKIVRI